MKPGLPQAAQATGPVFFGSEIYRGSSYGGSHPLRVPRVSTVMDLCRALHWLPPDRYRTSPRAKAAALTLWHDPVYVAALERAGVAGVVAGVQTMICCDVWSANGLQGPLSTDKLI